MSMRNVDSFALCICIGSKSIHLPILCTMSWHVPPTIHDATLAMQYTYCARTHTSIHITSPPHAYHSRIAVTGQCRGTAHVRRKAVPRSPVANVVTACAGNISRKNFRRRGTNTTTKSAKLQRRAAIVVPRF